MNVLEIEFHGGLLHLNGRPAADWVAEVYRLREENFRLAAGQCPRASGDEGGRPQCCADNDGPTPAEWAELDANARGPGV
jgi:hypothetical protein